jgi:hypothetical protein
MRAVSQQTESGARDSERRCGSSGSIRVGHGHIHSTAGPGGRDKCIDLCWRNIGKRYRYVVDCDRGSAERQRVIPVPGYRRGASDQIASIDRDPRTGLNGLGRAEYGNYAAFRYSRLGTVRRRTRS